MTYSEVWSWWWMKQKIMLFQWMRPKRDRIEWTSYTDSWVVYNRQKWIFVMLRIILIHAQKINRYYCFVLSCRCIIWWTDCFNLYCIVVTFNIWSVLLLLYNYVLRNLLVSRFWLLCFSLESTCQNSALQSYTL